MCVYVCVIGSHGGPKDKDGACLCVCRATADVFASDKSVWLRKRRSEDQTAEPRRSGAGERGRSLQSPAEKPSASCEPSSKHTTRSHATHQHHFKETHLSNSPILEKTAQRNSSILLLGERQDITEVQNCKNALMPSSKYIHSPVYCSNLMYLLDNLDFIK